MSQPRKLFNVLREYDRELASFMGWPPLDALALFKMVVDLYSHPQTLDVVLGRVARLQAAVMSNDREAVATEIESWDGQPVPREVHRFIVVPQSNTIH